MPSGQDYAQRLREDAQRTFAPQANDLEQELNNVKNDLLISLGQLGQKLETLRNFALPQAESIVGEALEEAARARELQLAALARFASDIRRKETQEEILELLLDEAGRFSPRVILFIARGGSLAGWSSRGFPPEVAAEINACKFEQAASPLFMKAIESEALTTSSSTAEEAALDFIRDYAPGPWHVFPLMAIGHPVALLLAAAADGQKCDMESLCILLDLTGMCIENIALKIMTESRAQAQPEPASPVTWTVPVSQETPAVEAVPAAVAAGEPASRRTEEMSRVEEAPVHPEDRSEPAREYVVPEEPVARVSPESTATEPGAVEVSPADEEHAAVPAGDWVNDAIASAAAAPQSTLHEEPKVQAAGGEEPPADEDKLHGDAKRFARLLVSEIKLYNEQRVLDGRLNKDIYVRLKKDIDKSREMYDKRVPPSVSKKIDYFHDEVIRILGENDPSTLGSDYPGSRAES